MKNDSKILIISNEAISDYSSNGRTLKNLLLKIPSDNLAQFYLHGTPDRGFCGSYFCVSDRTALNAFLCKKEHRKVAYSTPAEDQNRRGIILRPVRNYRNLVLRNMVWQSMRWWSKEFTAFLKNFSPDVVILQAGDAPFMYKIARCIARKYHAKLIMFNTEHYVLKKVMYASSETKLFWHNLLMRSLKKQYSSFMRVADYCVYNTKALESAYQKKYPHTGKSAVLYTASTLEPLPDKSGSAFSLLYCGNLGAGRCAPIQELADILYEVDPTATLDIYGKFPTQEMQDLVCKKSNVCYHGFVDYSELIPKMCEASLLVHCENKNRVENLQYAFSTKIADSLASGRPFLVYAPMEYPFVQYLTKKACAHIAINADELREKLKKCIEDKEFLYQYTDNAILTAECNHSIERNCVRIEEILSIV